MTNWQKFKKELTIDEYVSGAVFRHCDVCPARFFCSHDPRSEDYYPTCEDTFRAWAKLTYREPIDFDN